MAGDTQARQSSAISVAVGHLSAPGPALTPRGDKITN